MGASMRLCSLTLAVLLLSACSSADLLQDAEKTASGAIQDVTNIVEGAKKRIDQVQSGVDLMLEGKAMIEGGIKGEE